MRPTSAEIPGRLRCLLALLLGGCHVVEAKAWNLQELHDETGRHRYTGAIQGDTEYFFRHEVAGSFAIGGASFDKKSPVAIEDPALECLENLIELEAFDGENRRVAGLQVEWFARLAVEDPWMLSRERAVQGLARAARRLSAGVPAGLRKDETPVGAQAIGEALAGLVRVSRPVLDRGARANASERVDLEAACRVVGDLVLDLDGARRALRAVTALAAAVSDQNEVGQPLLDLSEDLQGRCVRQSLSKALFDGAPRVRAAAVVAAVASAGPEILEEVLVQLDRETSPEVLLRVLELVRLHGLPAGIPESSTLTPERARELRIAAILELLERPETSVRVGAMRALSKVTDAGIASLREEDWQAWWLDRREKRGP